MKTWLRSVISIIGGGLNMYANGTGWKQVALSAAIAGIGVVSQMTSSSNLTKAVSIPNPKGINTVNERF